MLSRRPGVAAHMQQSMRVAVQPGLHDGLVLGREKICRETETYWDQTGWIWSPVLFLLASFIELWCRCRDLYCE